MRLWTQNARYAGVRYPQAILKPEAETLGLLLWCRRYLMPYAAKRPCPEPGCNALTASGYCSTHKRAVQRAVDHQRGSRHERGYTSKWVTAREGWLRHHPLCGDRTDGPSDEHSACVQEGRVTPATAVDHIEPHRMDMKLFWDTRNWQSLCKRCHDTKTASEDGGFGNATR